MLAQTEKAPAGRPSTNRSIDATDSPATLSDMGITKDQSANWQTLASMSEAHFEATDTFRRAGEMLAQTPKSTGAAGIGTSAVEANDRTKPTLADMGIT